MDSPAAGLPAQSHEHRPARPLDGIKVLDLTVALAGPFCTLMLAGLGAEVIKVEAPGGSDIARTNPPFMGPDGLKFSHQDPNDISTSLLNRNRSKKSITLDLKTPEGCALYRRLASEVDVIVENLSEGAADKLGVGYADLREDNPRLVYAAITGLGHPSPYPGMKTMDIIVQALSGLMDATGSPDGSPTRSGIPIGDLVAPTFALSGVLAALFYRERTGIGQRVDICMLDTLVSWLAAEQFERLEQPGATARTGNFYDRFAPFGIYPTTDGYAAICAPRDAWARAVFDAMGRADLADDPRYVNRSQRMKNSATLNAAISAWTAERTAEEVVDAMFTERGVPAAKVREVREALHDENVRRRGAVVPLADASGREFATGVGIPIVFSSCQVGLGPDVPKLGQHNEELFGGMLGLSADELHDLARRRII